MDSTQQAWLLSMTSGLASSIGAATLYLDPILHWLGISNDFNILESHSVLSAMLAGASGIMAYTSINALTNESIGYLKDFSSCSSCQKYPGAITAVLFLVGAGINVALVKLVSHLMPMDSPIKHTCASHHPTPDSSRIKLSISGSSCEDNIGAASAGGSTNTMNTTRVYSPNSLSDSRQPLLPMHTDSVGPAGTNGEYKDGNYGGTAHSDHARCAEQCKCVEPCSHGDRHKVCEYACKKPHCIQVEHCHITPLYPHTHMHGQVNVSGEDVPERAHSRASQNNNEGGHHHHHHNARDGSLDDGHGCNGSGNQCHIHNHTHGRDDSDASHIHAVRHAHESHHHHHHNHHISINDPSVELESGAYDTDCTNDDDNKISTAEINSKNQKLLMHVGLQTAIAIALHKIPEGLIIFMSRKASSALGISVAASLFFHNLPEGIMLSLPLFLATGKRAQAFLVATAMGAAPPVIGAGIGWLVFHEELPDESPKGDVAGVFGIAFGVISGMMCMVALNGMLPTARIYDTSGNMVSFWFIAGIAIMLFANSTIG